MSPRLAFERFAYLLVWMLAAPLLPLRLLWRGRKEAGYLRHWDERLGGGAPLSGRPIWLHAVSVGEVRASVPLVERLLAECPRVPVLLTCMTAAGRATAESLFAGRVGVRFLPYDYGWTMRRFLRRTGPRLGLILETELWPNMMRQARRAGIALMLVNARLSARSARGYAKIPALTRASLASLRAVAAQSTDDAARLKALGAEQVTVTGNLKFDLTPPGELLKRGRAWRAAWGARAVLLAASTREGEEALIIEAFLRRFDPAVLLVLVPRHPQRFDAVAELLHEHGVAFVRRSDGCRPDANTRVILGDSLGELYAYYAASDIAFIGGSLLDYGGQNLIEAAACGTPVLVGPHTRNFAAAVAEAVAGGAARQVATAEDLMEAAAHLLDDGTARHSMAAAALAYAQAHRGATEKLWRLVQNCCPDICR